MARSQYRTELVGPLNRGSRRLPKSLRRNDATQVAPIVDLTEVLSGFARVMILDLPIRGILDLLVTRVVEVLPVTAASAGFLSSGANSEFCAASYPTVERLDALQVDLGEGPGLLAYRTGVGVAVPHLRADDRFPRFAVAALAGGFAAVWALPLLHQDICVGVLNVYQDLPGPLAVEHHRAATILADAAASYLVNAHTRTGIKLASERAVDRLLHDDLTGLPNRTLLLERIRLAFRRNERTGNIFAVLFVDLDEFKNINDRHGHSVGDAALIAVAERLAGSVRPGDVVARIHGDEFVIVCEDLHDRVEVTQIADRINAVLTAPLQLGGIWLMVAASVGIALVGPGTRTPEELLTDADHAMYRAKRGGGHGRYLFDDDSGH